MPFTKPLPHWEAPGIEPPTSLRQNGWKAGIKPPDEYFNYLQNKAYEALKELQEYAVHKDEMDLTGVATKEDLKVVKEALTTHLADNVKHITQEERTNWNSKAPESHTHTIDQVSELQIILDSKMASSLINKPSGVAGLDGNGKLLESLMPTGITKTISGSFVGDGTTGRLINIGATPKLVILLLKSKNTSIGNMFSIFNSLMNFHAEHYATTLSTHYEGARVVENGFNLNGAAYHNINGDTYHYYAFL